MHRRLPWILLLFLSACASSSGTTPPATGGATGTEKGEPPVAQARALPEPSVRPDLNASYRSAGLDVEGFQGRFESESREVFALREEILATLALESGMAVADIGAGTGLFTLPMADAVGSTGRVYAVDIAPAFLSHLVGLCADAELDQVTVVQASERSSELLPASVDVAFVCDTYHHFDYPRATLASLFRALRPGGRLVIVDFERIPGVSRDWILGHVRAGKDTVRGEIEEAGFVFEDQVDAGLVENYLIRFRRP